MLLKSWHLVRSHMLVLHRIDMERRGRGRVVFDTFLDALNVACRYFTQGGQNSVCPDPLLYFIVSDVIRSAESTGALWT